MATHTVIIFVLATTLPHLNTEYIPPGPAYPCPKETDNPLLYPCVCEKGTDMGLYVRCENTGLAVMSVGLGNIAGLGLPIERLLLKECRISHLFGPLLHRSTIRTLHITDTPIKSVDEYAFFGVNRTLQELYMHNTMIDVFPKEAFKHNNLTSLSKSAFGNLPTTFKLDLSYNQLSDLGQKSFDGMQQLLDLSLRGNQLEHIQNEVFKGLVALRRLDLSYNGLDKIDNKTNGLLDDCLSLEMVNLSHNRFGFLSRKMFPANPWIPYRLREVDLSYNEIPVVTYDITFGGKNLKKLDLSNNYINDVRNNVLGNLTSLEILDLSNNQLTDLVSRTSDTKFNLPDNITEIYLQNNTLEKLPVETLMKSSHLKVLDLRNNLLTSFYPELVKKIRENNLIVYFENNKLKCDCFTRPLKHYLQKMPDSILKNDQKYQNLVCFEPPSLENQNFLDLNEDRLLCASNVELNEKMREYGNTEFDFTSEPDVLFRDIQYSQTTIYAFWYVSTTDDVADFYIYIRDDTNKLFFSQDVAYNLRSLTINVDKDFRNALKNNIDGGRIEICIQAKSSNNFARKWFDSQCQAVQSNYESWPKKLTVDKRRLSKKKVRYGWFSNSVLGLVSDSILITLCIFIGVCFRRLADLDI